jgi:hypothetical protein
MKILAIFRRYQHHVFHLRHPLTGRNGLNRAIADVAERLAKTHFGESLATLLN